MKKVQFGFASYNNEMEVVRTVEVTEETLNIVLKAQGYNEIQKNYFESEEFGKIKAIKILN